MIMTNEFKKLAAFRNKQTHPRRIDLRLIENVVNLVGLFEEEKTAFITSLEAFQKIKNINDLTFAIEIF